MKILLPCLLMASSSAWAQPVAPTSPREALLLKSHNQRTAARVLLIGGAVVAGTVIYATAPGKSVSFDALPLVGGLGVAGGAAVLSSIPLFVASARNKRKAQAAISLQLQALPAPQWATARRGSMCPALGLCLPL
ncbi:hypothetical protein [Hymenobacter sp. B1770]|uniref:hypothetical protein n=1 Tax=Hymenobacter sp. B1770 TaxID=1718788 RepID=UPI003CF32A6F